jgi:SAM-dependent methyltransferase
MPPGSVRVPPLRGLVNILYNTGKPGAIAAGLLALGLLFFARPQFHVSLSSMNTVSEATLAADALFTEVWGSVGERVLLMNSADVVGKLQADNDRLLDKIEQDIDRQVLAAAFVPSMIFPGGERGEENLAAWRNFWDERRTEQVKEALRSAGRDLGFTADAFNDFFTLLDRPSSVEPQPIGADYFSLLGISDNAGGSGLIQFITVVPGKNYDGAGFFGRYGEDGKILDTTFFTKRLADILFATFTTMLVVIAVSVVVLLFFFYLSLPLTLLTLLPPFFAYICTLGTLRLIGRPLDIPALMLSVVILGMGVDYAIFCVRAHQRYRDIDHPSYVLVRVAVFMAGTSTLIGFGVLCLAEHSLLKSIGITSLLGIGYSLLGTFLLLPPLLRRYLVWEDQRLGGLTGQNRTLPIRVRDRFRTLEPYPRMFARFKLQYDPMFQELPRMLAGRGDIKTIIDIGCGYGVPACWCLERYRDALVYGIDPDHERVRVAALAIGDRGVVTTGWAPELPEVPHAADVVLLLDMLHYLDDRTAAAVLDRSFQVLGNNGLLVTRFVLPPAGRPSWSWHLEDSRIKLSGRRPWYRGPERMAEWMRQAGFVLMVNEVSTGNPELFWMVCRAEKEAAGADGQHP